MLQSNCGHDGQVALMIFQILLSNFKWVDVFFNNVALGHSISLSFFKRYTLTICGFFFIYNVNISRYP